MTRYFKKAIFIAFAAIVLCLHNSVTAQVNVTKASAEPLTKTVEIDVANTLEQQAGLYGSEMIADKMPVAEVHASTIEEIEGGIVTAWFGGAEEGAYAVVICVLSNFKVFAIMTRIVCPNIKTWLQMQRVEE